MPGSSSLPVKQIASFIRGILFLFVTFFPHAAAFAGDPAIGGACSGTIAAGPQAASGNNVVCSSSLWQYPAYQLGASSATCNTTNAGMMQWTGTFLQGCNGASWFPLDTASVNNAGSSTSINWATASTQYTSASCGAFTFTNMQDGGNYQLFIEGTTSGTCSFSQTGLTFKLPSNHGATTSGTMTVYSFTRAGSYVFVTWIPGY